MHQQTKVEAYSERCMLCCATRAESRLTSGSIFRLCHKTRVELLGSNQGNDVAFVAQMQGLVTPMLDRWGDEGLEACESRFQARVDVEVCNWRSRCAEKQSTMALSGEPIAGFF
jgi:hypothetical protein